MTHDPTTREGRDELRRLIDRFKQYLKTPLGEATKDDVAAAVAFTNGWLALVEPALNALDAIDARDAEIARLRDKLATARTQLEEIVCVDPVDAGVILKSWESPTHSAVLDGKPVTVYDYPHFSELGGALIDLWRTIE